jgi:RND family efflux transporter MFP subunit
LEIKVYKNSVGYKMKKAKYISIFLMVFIAIVATLLYNKSKIQAKSKVEFKDVYYVSVKKVSAQNLGDDISLVGTITGNSDVNIVSETQGKVTAVYSKVGDYKPAGSILFQIDDELKQAAYKTAEANYEKAKKDYERYQTLNSQKTASDAQFDVAKLAYISAESQYIVAKRQFNDAKIKTPISGLITARNVELGTMVQPGTIVANVVDLAKLKIKINVSEKNIVKLKVGNKVNVTTTVYSGVKYTGIIETISSKGDDAHSFPVEVSVINTKDNPLKAGMFARVLFDEVDKRNALTIPRESLVGSIKNPQVYVVENGVTKIRNVVLGEEFGTNVEVLDGLKDGETIVTSGQNSLKENVKVEILD